MNLKKLFTSSILLITILFSTTLQSCLGSFAATNGLISWNRKATDNKFVNQLIFWVLAIIPVYDIVVLGDLIVFNLLEFWTGDNPIAMNDDDSQSQFITYNGKNYEIIATKNKMTFKDEQGKIISKLIYDQNDASWSLSQNNQIQKLVSFENLNINEAQFRIHNPECQEGTVYVVNTNDVNLKSSMMKW